MTDIPALVAEYAALKSEADRIWRRVKELEHEIITDLREEFPAAWRDWERGKSSFKAHGITIPVTRQWDASAVKAEIGEERPDIVTTETKIVEKVDGRKLASLMRDEAYAARLEKCMVPSVPKVRLG